MTAPANGNVTLTLGNGDGTFGSPVIVASGANGFAVGDLNGDGALDLATANGAQPIGDTTITGRARVITNHGDGTFAAPVELTTSSHAQEVQIADFHADGRLDLALACNYSNLDVFLNPGDGRFAAKTSFHTNTLSDFRGFIFNPYRIAAGDVDGNGTVDLALVFTEAPKLASVLLNDGTGTFAASTLSHLNAGFVQGTIAVSDLDEDGRADVPQAHQRLSYVCPRVAEKTNERMTSLPTRVGPGSKGAVNSV